VRTRSGSGGADAGAYDDKKGTDLIVAVGRD